MNRKPLEVLIYGAGAVGATFGWRAAENAHVRVTTVCRSNYSVVSRQGFKMQSRMWGSGKFMPYRVVSSVNAVRGIPFDYVVCANKIVHSSDGSFIDDIRPVVGHGTTLVAAQNGVSVEPMLASAFPDSTILSSICYVSCVQDVPGIVQQVAAIKPYAFHLGSYTSTPESLASLQQLTDLDERFEVSHDITAERWVKLIFNGSWNPVAAIYRMTTDQVYENPRALQHVEDLAREICVVAQALRGDIPPSTAQITTNFARNQPPITLSMLQDVRAGRPIEVEALCGSILRQAEQLGISTPALRSTYQTLLVINRNIEAARPMRVIPLCIEESSSWSLDGFQLAL